MSHQESILLTELLNTGKLSVRALNICNALKICTIKDLGKFIEGNGDFLRIRNCGEKTKGELLQIYFDHKILEQECESLPAANSNVISQKLEDNPNFNKLLKTEFLKLSTRAQNCLSQLFNNCLPAIDEFRVNFIENTFLLGRQKNMGAKTFKEITFFIDRGITIYYKCIEEVVSPIESTSRKFELATGIKLIDTYHLGLVIKNIFPIIEFCAENLSELLALEKVEEFILRNSFELLDKTYDYQTIGTKFNLSAERIRQISIRLKDEIPDRLRESVSVILSSTNYRNLFSNQEIIDFEYFNWGSLIDSEISKYGKIFSSYVLGILFSNTFYSLNKTDKIKRPAVIGNYELYNSIKLFNGVYLVNGNFISKEELMDVYNLCVSEMVNRQPKDTSISLVKCLKDMQIDQYSSASNILSYILKKELKIEIRNEFIHINRNTSKSVVEYAVEALEKLSRPSHISDIFFQILSQNSEFDSSEDSVKTTITRNKKIFIYFGRSSTYGLRVWEKEFKNIKGGTIRDIVEEFLRDFDEPSHISSIAKYVNKYRKTNEYSILSNLKIAGHRRFRFFKNGYVGLSSKNYQRSESIAKHQYHEISLEKLLKSIFSK